ncbi:MAG: acyltransferase [Candidatus Eisenbacteria bacterium]|nr:acyltransferase [Candidatus Eisenbacteria bacterium]
MRAAAVQFAPAFGEVRPNLDGMLAMAAHVEADLLVFPELALSGYVFATPSEVLELSQAADARELDEIAEAAAARRATFVVGFAERAGRAVFNSALLAGPDGTRAIYRKIHLFDREKALFAPGDRPPEVVEVAGVRYGLMVCFDWIFPETARTLALLGADVLCHPANLVLPFCQDAMITRCIENRVFSVTANRIGTEARAGTALTFTGMSEIVSPRGAVLARGSVDRAEIVTADVDPAAARDKMITASNHVLDDRRTDLYRLR